MNIPNTIKSKISDFATKMLCQLGIEQSRIDAAIRSFFAELYGDDSGERGVNMETAGRIEERKIEKPFTTAEVAALIGKHPNTVRAYARRGALIRVKGKGMGRSIGYTAASVRALVEGRAE